jgi:hypothetical protein
MRSVARPLKTLVSRWKGRNGLALSLLAPALGVALMLPAGAAPKTSPPSVQPPSVVAATNWDVRARSGRHNGDLALGDPAADGGGGP